VAGTSAASLQLLCKATSDFNFAPNVFTTERSSLDFVWESVSDLRFKQDFAKSKCQIQTFFPNALTTWIPWDIQNYSMMM
jgi:hypothetical protein